ncbi:hypothetical protein JHW40_22550 (plasmid) [Paracoccus alcaliphilus]|nr:hypothetical protein JHW40_22550 [Paracoccus alcaliphilus]
MQALLRRRNNAAAFFPLRFLFSRVCPEAEFSSDFAGEEFADEAPAEQQDADHEDDAGDDGDGKIRCG